MEWYRCLRCGHRSLWSCWWSRTRATILTKRLQAENNNSIRWAFIESFHRGHHSKIHLQLTQFNFFYVNRTFGKIFVRIIVVHTARNYNANGQIAFVRHRTGQIVSGATNSRRWIGNNVIFGAAFIFQYIFGAMNQQQFVNGCGHKEYTDNRWNGAMKEK